MMRCCPLELRYMASSDTERNRVEVAPPPRQRGNELGATTANVAAAVESRRTELGLTRRELAARLAGWGRRFTANAVQKLEVGERRIDVDDLDALARALNVSVEYLLGTGADWRRLSWEQATSIGRRNPLLDKAIQVAVVSNSEDRAELLDYLEGAIRTAQWRDSWGRFETAVLEAGDAEAAALIVDRLQHEPGWQPLRADMIATLLLGGDRERADRIMFFVSQEGGNGEG